MTERVTLLTGFRVVSMTTDQLTVTLTAKSGQSKTLDIMFGAERVQVVAAYVDGVATRVPLPWPLVESYDLALFVARHTIE